MKAIVTFFCLTIITLNAAVQEFGSNEYSVIAGFPIISGINKGKLDSVITFTDKLIETGQQNFFKNVRSMIVWHQGDTIFEKYYNGCRKDSLNNIQSQTKSIIALLIGIAVDKGYIKNEDEHASEYFPEYFGTGDNLKAAVTIKDLLTMSYGFQWEEFIPLNDPNNDNMNMYNSGDYLQNAVSRSMVLPPYKEFNYNSGCPVIAAGIIEKATGLTLDEFAAKYLFNPLGIVDYYWIKDRTGFCHAGGGLYLKPYDMLKIGILVLNNGKFEGRDIIPEKWIKKMTQPYFSSNIDNAYYGYFWWINDMKTGKGNTTNMISARSAGGQRLYIFTEYELIIAFTEINYTTPLVSPLIIKEGILPPAGIVLPGVETQLESIRHRQTAAVMSPTNCSDYELHPAVYY